MDPTELTQDLLQTYQVPCICLIWEGSLTRVRLSSSGRTKTGSSCI